MLFLPGTVCFCAPFRWGVFFITTLSGSLRLFGVCRALVFISAVAVSLVFIGFTLSLTGFTTVVFFDCSLDFCFFFCVLAACLFSFSFFFHGFNLFSFLSFLLNDFHFGFTTAVLVVVGTLVVVVEGSTQLLVTAVLVTLAVVVEGLTLPRVTGGLVVSLNFLGGGLVGFSFMSSTVTEMAQMSVSSHFHSFTCWILQPHVLNFKRLDWIFSSENKPECLKCFPLCSACLMYIGKLLFIILYMTSMWLYNLAV